MRRLAATPRPDHRRTVVEQGLVFPDTPLPEGGTAPYWYEAAYYSLTSEEVDDLERTTGELYAMCLEAARFLASGEFGLIGLREEHLALARASLERGDPALYGRFDLHYDGRGPAKLFEFNADTPTGLVESSVVQWFWLQDVAPDRDQWNSVHERLVDAWRALAPSLRSPQVHFAHLEGETSGEEWMTAAYMRDTAQQAGLVTVGVPVEQIGWDSATYRFVDLEDRPIDTCFKLYPWENMVREDFGRHVLVDRATRWIEPAWKLLLSNKALLAALWHLYPDHANLLPAHLDEPGPIREWVRKPLHGREGDGIWIGGPDGVRFRSGSDVWGAEGYCYQQFLELPSYDGNHPVLGTWVVAGMPAGLGIRESDSLVTDTYARFVPHLLDAPAPDEATRARWLRDVDEG